MQSVRHIYCHAIVLVCMLLWMGQGVWAQDVNEGYISIVSHKSDAAERTNDSCLLLFRIKKCTLVNCYVMVRKHNTDTIIFTGKTKWPATLASNIRLPRGQYDVECTTDTLVSPVSNGGIEKLWSEHRALFEMKEGGSEVEILYQPKVFFVRLGEEVGWDYIGETASGARFVNNASSSILEMQQQTYSKEKVIIL